MSGCEDCDRPYGDEHGFPDFIIPLWAWKRISTTGDEGGLLCPSCIIARVHVAGFKCPAGLVSGNVRSVTEDTIQLMRQVENIEEHLVGRAGLTAKIASARDTDRSPEGGDRGTGRHAKHESRGRAAASPK
jgi:hypothetical protein